MAEEILVKKDMQIGDVISKYPKTAEVMMNAGLHCVGCHVASWESIEQGAKAHGMKDEDVDKMVEEMNKAASEKQ